jgi:hypothetical protein
MLVEMLCLGLLLQLLVAHLLQPKQQPETKEAFNLRRDEEICLVRNSCKK